MQGLPSPPSRSHRELLDQGYTVLGGLLGPSEIAQLWAAIRSLVAAVAPPSMHAPEATPLSERAFVTASGLALPRLLNEFPELRPLVAPRALVELAREVLGADLRLEIAGASVSDASRPFFRWHSHIDGEDEGARFESGRWPAVAGVRRVLSLLYLNDLDDDTGPLYVLPRRAGDPTAPPFPIDQEVWPGQVELRLKAGDLVAIDQCTWHAARSMRVPGLRAFAGCYFAASGARPVPGADPELRL